MLSRTWKSVFAATGAAAFSIILLLTLRSAVPVGAETTILAATGSAGESFVYQFDPDSETFVFSFTIPTVGADAQDITVISETSHLEVWFTEFGADRIGRLTYTDTLDYAYQYYTPTAGSRPLNLVSGGGYIWFTEAGRDRIGRLDPVLGQIDEFTATVGSYPADLAYDSSDDTIWFTEMEAGQIGHLDVTSPTEYTLTEYTHATVSDGKPYGIVLKDGSVYFAQTANSLVTIFTQPDDWIHLHDPVLPIPQDPYALTLDGSGLVWATERDGNRVTSFAFGTYNAVVPYTVTPESSLPTAIAADTNDDIWFTQWHAGQIGRLLPGSSPQRDYYPLPLPGLAPTGIAVDDDGDIWVLASRPYRVYLPMVCSCWDESAPSSGVQFYSGLDGNDGFHKIADAGTQWVRKPISWASVEPSNTTPENYNWSSVDYSVNNATSRGVQLILTIGGQPSWAATYQMGPVTDTADIIEFVGALVERYDGDGTDDAPGSPTVRHFELYNEPDNYSIGGAQQGGYGYWGHNGVGYADLLQTLYPTVKSASPRAQLVFGGIALEPGMVFDMDFLDDVLSACQGHDCFDVMNFHYYPCFRGNWKSYGIDILGKANYVQQKLTTYGFADKPMIVSETGYPSGVVWGDDERQSRYVVKVNVRARAAKMPAIIWYKSDDTGAGDLPGLLDDTQQPKPAYWAFDRMTDMLARATYQRTLTAADTGTSEIEGYSFSVCGQRLDVVWTEGTSWSSMNDDPEIQWKVPAESVRVSDKFGNETLYLDHYDGENDGRTTITVGGDPLFVEHNP